MVGACVAQLVDAVVTARDGDGHGAGATRGGDIERRVADDEAVARLEAVALRERSALDCALRQLGAVFRVGAEAAEAEVVVELPARELDARGALDATRCQAEQVAPAR